MRETTDLESDLESRVSERRGGREEGPLPRLRVGGGEKTVSKMHDQTGKWGLNHRLGGPGSIGRGLQDKEITIIIYIHIYIKI